MRVLCESAIDITWSVTVDDIESTLREAIDKIMSDFGECVNVK
jgi:hypothetical protein